MADVVGATGWTEEAGGTILHELAPSVFVYGLAARLRRTSEPHTAAALEAVGGAGEKLNTA